MDTSLTKDVFLGWDLYILRYADPSQRLGTADTGSTAVDDPYGLYDLYGLYDIYTSMI